MFKILSSLNRMLVPAKANRYGPASLTSLLYSTFQPREFQFETVTPESGTLLHRFSRHIAHSKRDWQDATEYSFKYSLFYPVYRPDKFLEQLKSISNHDLSKLICLTSDIRGKSDVRLYTDVLNILDEESEARVDQCSFYELVRLIHGFIYLLPTRIFRLKTYRKAMPRLVELFGENPNDKDFMTVVFFLGLWKKNANGTRLLEQFLKNHMEQFFDKLELMDFTILANASYKTSLRIGQERFTSRLLQEIGGFQGNDVDLLVTLVKCARMNRIRSDVIVEKIRETLKRDASLFDFRELSHLFAYVSEIQKSDDELNRLILSESVKRIEWEVEQSSVDQPSQSFRPKDLSNFLWSCSNLSIPFEQLEISPKELTEVIFRKLDAGEYRIIPDTLVDTCLSLWIMDYPSIDMLASIYGDRQFMQFFKKDRVKVESRRDLLLACAEIERPEAFKIISKLPRVKAANLARPAPDYLIQNRSGLQRVKNLLEKLEEELGIREMKYNLPIKFLNFAGLLLQLEDGRCLNLDVLEAEHCLSDDQTPTGLMNLKTRLMDKFDVESAMVNVMRIETDDQLIKLLRDTFHGLTVTKVPTQDTKAS